MALPLDPIPQYDDLVDPQRKMIDRWYRWLAAFVARVVAAPQRVGTTVHRSGSSASIAASASTTLYTPSQSGILFLVCWRARITTAAGTNSSLIVTINWTEGGIAVAKSFAAITGNTTATADGGSVPVRPDSGQPIRYSTTYASTGAPAMIHDLSLTVEDLT